MIVPSTPHNGIIITVIGVLISGYVFFRAYRLYESGKNSVPRGTTRIDHSRQELEKGIALIIPPAGAYETLLVVGDGEVISQIHIDVPAEQKATENYIESEILDQKRKVVLHLD